jgi:hypothetical protein
MGHAGTSLMGHFRTHALQQKAALFNQLVGSTA